MSILITYSCVIMPINKGVMTHRVGDENAKSNNDCLQKTLDLYQNP